MIREDALKKMATGGTQAPERFVNQRHQQRWKLLEHLAYLYRQERTVFMRFEVTVPFVPPPALASTAPQLGPRLEADHGETESTLEDAWRTATRDAVEDADDNASVTESLASEVPEWWESANAQSPCDGLTEFWENTTELSEASVLGLVAPRR